MRGIKKILLSFVVIVLVLPSFLATASLSASSEGDMSSTKEGRITSKDEVVYATLSPTGKQQEVYVVNTLDVRVAGNIIDHGSYTQLKNLSDLSELKQSGDKIQVTAPKGEFFYQGYLDKVSLPWEIKITYLLDGKEISPEQLAGKDGKVQIKIETKSDIEKHPVFVENYLLQIAVPLDYKIFSNIHAEDGMIANVGKNKQVTYTVMPEKEGTFVLEVDAVQFELEGIDITAIPSAMAIDAPDTDEMTGDMRTLADATAELNDGVSKLKTGVSELNKGAAQLVKGSAQYKSGINQLHGGSSELVAGSTEIKGALAEMAAALENVEMIDPNGMGQLTEGLLAVSDGLTETVVGLGALNEGYGEAYAALDAAMLEIPALDVSEEDMMQLYGSGANPEVVGVLVDTYKAARVAQGTYTQVKPAFAAVAETLPGVIAGLEEMASNVKMMAGELSTAAEGVAGLAALDELFNGIVILSGNYGEFHSGLVTYTKGVGQLASSYADVHSGVVGLSKGTAEVESGVKDLQKGTRELEKATSDLPEQMESEIDKMIGEFDKSDFDVVSFVSEKNDNVNLVQFVLKTDSIKYDEEDDVEETKKEKRGFWARLLDLFR